ncbi:MAG TPA: DNA-directed RNA polymerase subunit H [archaeon]|nr:DNA-directed RNA polymerase subunit H [archaeon]
MSKASEKKSLKDKEEQVDIFKSNLVPKHEIMSESEIADLMQKFNIKLKHLPRIKKEDAVIKLLDGKHGDVVRITRRSHTAGESLYYRVVS